MTTGRINQVVVARTVTPARRPQSSRDRPAHIHADDISYFSFFPQPCPSPLEQGPDGYLAHYRQIQLSGPSSTSTTSTPTSRVTFLRRRHRGASTLRDVSPSSLLPTPTKAHRRPFLPTQRTPPTFQTDTDHMHRPTLKHAEVSHEPGGH